MSQKNDTPVLILSLLVTLALIGGGFWWFANRFGSGQPSATNPGQTAPNANSDPNNSLSLKDRLSLGEKLLITDGASTDKKDGVAAIAAQNWSGAIASFQAALQNDRNDPESLIYLNNAKIGAQTAYTIAVSVPATKSSNPALEISARGSSSPVSSQSGWRYQWHTAEGADC